MLFFRNHRLRILLTEVGYHSTGDQTLFAATGRRLLQAGCAVTVLDRIGMASLGRHAGLGSIRYLDFRLPRDIPRVDSPDALELYLRRRHSDLFAQLESLLAKSDIVMTASGGRMTDGYAITRNLAVSFAAIRRNVPVINLHQSYGPISTPEERALVAAWGRRSLLTVSRDDVSLEFLRSLSIPEDRLQDARDLVFAEKVPANTGAMFDLGLNLRFGFNGHAEVRAVEHFLQEYRHANPGARILVFTTTNPLPNEVVHRLAPLATEIRPEIVPYPDGWRVARSCRLHVTDSYHGFIFCVMTERPVVLMQSDFQSWKFLGTTAPGLPPWNVLPPLMDEHVAESLLAELHSVERNAEEHRHRMALLAAYGRERAEQGWSRVLAAAGVTPPRRGRGQTVNIHFDYTTLLKVARAKQVGLVAE